MKSCNSTFHYALTVIQDPSLHKKDSSTQLQDTSIHKTVQKFTILYDIGRSNILLFLLGANIMNDVHVLLSTKSAVLQSLTIKYGGVTDEY